MIPENGGKPNGLGVWFRETLKMWPMFLLLLGYASYERQFKREVEAFHAQPRFTRTDYMVAEALLMGSLEQRFVSREVLRANQERLVEKIDSLTRQLEVLAAKMDNLKTRTR